MGPSTARAAPNLQACRQIAGKAMIETKAQKLITPLGQELCAPAASPRLDCSGWISVGDWPKGSRKACTDASIEGMTAGIGRCCAP